MVHYASPVGGGWFTSRLGEWGSPVGGGGSPVGGGAFKQAGNEQETDKTRARAENWKETGRTQTRHKQEMN